MFKKCLTDQRFIWKRNTTYEIEALVACLLRDNQSPYPIVVDWFRETSLSYIAAKRLPDKFQYWRNVKRPPNILLFSTTDARPPTSHSPRRCSSQPAIEEGSETELGWPEKMRTAPPGHDLPSHIIRYEVKHAAIQFIHTKCKSVPIKSQVIHPPTYPPPSALIALIDILWHNTNWQ